MKTDDFRRGRRRRMEQMVHRIVFSSACRNSCFRQQTKRRSCFHSKQKEIKIKKFHWIRQRNWSLNFSLAVRSCLNRNQQNLTHSHSGTWTAENTKIENEKRRKKNTPSSFRTSLYLFAFFFVLFISFFVLAKREPNTGSAHITQHTLGTQA